MIKSAKIKNDIHNQTNCKQNMADTEKVNQVFSNTKPRKKRRNPNINNNERHTTSR